MKKNIYSYYRKRLIQIGGNSKCLYLDFKNQTNASDIGKILAGRHDKIEEFTNFLASDRRGKFALVSRKDKKAILDMLDEQEKAEDAEIHVANSEQARKIQRQNAKRARDELKRELENDVTSIKKIKTECEEREKEIGRNELFVGYPFVFGNFSSGGKTVPIKAPLLLFPVRIEISGEDSVYLKHDIKEKILLNPAFISAYAFERKMNTDKLVTAFDNLLRFESLESLIKDLQAKSIKINSSVEHNLYSFSKFKEPKEKNEFSVRYGAVLSRFSLSDPLYNDYATLEKRKETNPSIELLASKSTDSPSAISKAFSFLGKKEKESVQDSSESYFINSLDYSQRNAVRMVGSGKSYAITTPPGTQCAKVTAEIIVDSLCKKKKVLLITDKKMALDAIYSHLAPIKDKCITIDDQSNETADFYAKLKTAHEKNIASSLIESESLLQEYKEISESIRAEEGKVEDYFKILDEKRPFGLSLSEMYNSTHKIGKSSSDYGLYCKLIENNSIMALDYQTLKYSVDGINNSSLAKDYYEFITEKLSNPLFDLMLKDVDPRTVRELKMLIASVKDEKRAYFNTANHPYYRQIMANFKMIDNESLVNLAVKAELRAKETKTLFASKARQSIKNEFLETITAIKEYTEDYVQLRRAFTEAGYVEIISNILSGNPEYPELIHNALAKYEKMQKLEEIFKTTDQRIISILDFAFINAKDKKQFNDIINKIILLRTYHELTVYENALENQLKNPPSLSEFKEKVLRLDETAFAISKKLTGVLPINEYSAIYMHHKNKDKYLAEISKGSDFLPIKRIAELYGELIFSIFPCWLLTPENVSTLLPLKKNLFDLVIFDGSSQIFIEEAIPSLYRAKSIAVMGDEKQIRPTAEFMRRCLGRDTADEGDELFVTESLFESALKKLPNTKLRYHYGAEAGDLIDFSNKAFYSSELITAPTVNKKQKKRHIDFKYVCGEVLSGENRDEADEVISILTELSKKKKDCGSIGIITFSQAQQNLIVKLIEEECKKSKTFALFIEKELGRADANEDNSIFIKTVENAQGEKRDNIIISPVIAHDCDGNVNTAFLTQNFNIESSINVAITRAKKKFIYISSILPDDVLKIDNSTQNLDVFRQFLSYLKSSSSGSGSEVKALLSEFEQDACEVEASYSYAMILLQDKLEKMGYTVKLYPDGISKRISLAIYDEKTDKYLVGVILDSDAYEISDSILERDVYYPYYLEKFGWSIVRVSAREWWNEPKKVLTSIIEAAEYTRLND